MKSLDRIVWRFTESAKKNKPFRVNQNDLDALADLTEFVERAEKNQFEANELFAKLYIYLYMKVLETSNTTVFDNIARKKIGNLLNKSITELMKMFCDSLNESEQYQFLNELGIEIKHPSLVSEDENKKEIELLRENTKTQEGKDRFFGKVWNLETVKEPLIAEVNQMINLYKN